MQRFENWGQELLQRAMFNLPTGLFICDKDGIVQFINAAYANYLQCHPEDMIGKPITDFIPDSRIPAVLASGKPELAAMRTFAEGETTLMVNRIPLRDDQGAIIGACSLTLFDTPDQLNALQRQIEKLDKKVTSCEQRIKSALTPIYTIDSLLGTSESMQVCKKYLLRYAYTEAPILILGATGTGKELAASAIHMASRRADKPFVSINCAAIPQELFESEVFGYTAGAFSGAHRDGKVGQIELAHKGTLFLDEVGDLPLHAQVKLLRVLEDKTVRRLGSSHPRSVDFRLVAATNRDLPAMISAGTFREDLYYRINSMTLNLPPLRERKEDIPLLTHALLSRMGSDSVRCTESALQALLEYSWPGNIRELRNVLLRALSLCQHQEITLRDLPPEIQQIPLPRQETPTLPLNNLNSTRNDSERQAILAALANHTWNVLQTAKSLGISRATLYEKMKRYGIRRA